jgi:peptide/nickel transport system permease protein
MTITHWLRFIARRLALMMLTLWLITLLIFVITSVIPGDAAQYMLGQHATPETLAALRARLGLDQPAHVRYLRWMGNALHGDLGISAYLNGPIGPTLALRLRNSLVLGGFGFALAVPLAILLGIISGMHAGHPLIGSSRSHRGGLIAAEFVGAVVFS